MVRLKKRRTERRESRHPAAVSDRSRGELQPENGVLWMSFFILFWVTAIGSRQKPEFRFLPRQLRWTLLPKERCGDSLSGRWPLTYHHYPFCECSYEFDKTAFWSILPTSFFSAQTPTAVLLTTGTSLTTWCLWPGQSRVQPTWPKKLEYSTDVSNGNEHNTAYRSQARACSVLPSTAEKM